MENKPSFWEDQYKLSAGGAALKNRVERLYFSILQEGMDAPCQGKRLLEIGPGAGLFGDVAQAAGFEYACVERDAALVPVLEAKGFSVIQDQFPTPKIEDESFDVIHASHVIEHSDTCAHAVRFVQDAKRALKHGGCIMLNFPNFMHHRQYFYIQDYTHNFQTTPLRIRNLLFDNGFEVTHTCETLLFFRNRALVPVLKVLCDLVPSFCYELVARLFVKGFAGSCRIFCKSNVSIVARKPKE